MATSQYRIILNPRNKTTPHPYRALPPEPTSHATSHAITHAVDIQRTLSRWYASEAGAADLMSSHALEEAIRASFEGDQRASDFHANVMASTRNLYLRTHQLSADALVDEMRLTDTASHTPRADATIREAREEATQIAEQFRTASVFIADADVCTILIDSFDAFPTYRLQAFDLPAATGFLFFASPIEAHLPDGGSMPVYGLLWQHTARGNTDGISIRAIAREWVGSSLANTGTPQFQLPQQPPPSAPTRRRYHSTTHPTHHRNHGSSAMNVDDAVRTIERAARDNPPGDGNFLFVIRMQLRKTYETGYEDGYLSGAMDQVRAHAEANRASTEPR